MIPFFIGFLTCLSAFFRSRCNLGLEILALRQQLGVLKRKNPRPRLRTQDRIFWILLRRLWHGWRSPKLKSFPTGTLHFSALQLPYGLPIPRTQIQGR